MRRAPVLAGLLALAPAVGAAEEGTALWRALTAEEMRAVLVGRQLDGVYSSGKPFTETMNADMSTHYVDPGITTSGTVLFMDDVMCFAYTLPMETGCFHVWQRSENCFDVYFAAGQGRAAASYAERLIGTGWDSRMWRADAASTCPAAAVS